MRASTTPLPRIDLHDGTSIPQLGFGTLHVQPDRERTEANAATTAEVVRQALEAGYRHIDTAQAYGNEHGVGQAIAASGLPRDELYITSKLSNDNHARGDVRRSCVESLERLGLDQLDLFLVHWPLPMLDEVDYVATWKAMTGLVAEGLVRSAGVSNFQPAHLDRIILETGVTPVVNQVELHPYFPNRAVREAGDRHDIALEAHSPLGHDRKLFAEPVIERIARTYDRTIAQITLRWHLQQGTIVIPKSSRPERMAENMDIFDFTLSADDVAAIDALDRGPSGRVGPDPDRYTGV